MKKLLLLALITALTCAVSVSFSENAVAASTKVNMYSASPGEHTAINIDNNEYGFRFNALAPFQSVTAACPSWSDNIGVMTIKLYKWNGNYASTVSGVAIATKTAIDFRDNSEVSLSFREQNAGEYLYTVMHSTSAAGIWTYTGNHSSIYMYKNGIRTTGSLHGYITFTQSVDTYFGALSADIAQTNSLGYEIDPTKWVAVDGLGRTLPTNDVVGESDKTKYVGLFYWTWHYNFASFKPYNISQIMKQYPEAKNDYNSDVWKQYNAGYYFWDEPVYGYYTSTDKYVIRKDAELLANAGVDVVIFDCTNGSYTWKPAYTAMFEVYEQARNDGIKTPQIAFMFPFGASADSNKAITEVYNDIYKQRKYEDLWFLWKGKPLIMAHTSTSLAEEIRSFFTFRKNDPLYFSGDTTTLGGTTTWGWLSVYPQAKYYGSNGTVEQMTVGVAQNANANGLTAMNGTGVYGRSHTYNKNFSYSYQYDGKTVIANSSIANSEYYGLNFQEQWDRALSVDPEFIFVTGWNEFVMSRIQSWGGVSNAFPDQFTEEYSRDCAVTNGELKDYYYYQLISNIRKYKGVTANAAQDKSKYIDINAGTNQWSSVDGSAHYTNNTPDRDTDGWSGTHYINNSMRNDFVMTKVSYDRKNVYFYAETLNTITPYTDSGWMNLFIDTKEADGKNDHWENFEFVINRKTPTDTKAFLERSTGGWSWETVGEVSYTLNGNILQIEVPRSLLDMTGDSLSFNYKWADNSMTDGNIMSFYTNGDVAPAGRMAVCFSSGNNPEYADGFAEGTDSAGYTVDNASMTIIAPQKTTYEAAKAHFGSLFAGTKADSDYLSTGDIISSGSIKYKIIVLGDIDKSGDVAVNDYALLKMHFKNQISLDEDQLAAADVRGAKGLTATDYLAIKRIISIS